LAGGFDFVTPIYVRHKYDGTITNHIAYPLLRALFGLRVRQPNGGDFGISGKLARALLSEKIWNDNIANYGIDLWMSTIAIARHFRVCQAFLATPKVHRPEDPSSDLSTMFKQVVATMFDLMIEFEYIWKDTYESRPSSIFGFGLGVVEKPQTVAINTDRLFKEFRKGYEKYGKIWRQIIPLPEFRQIEDALKIESKENFYYHSSLWARILFSFAVAYKNNEIDRNLILEALIPFYYSRILSYVMKTRNQDTRESEEYLENITRVFESEKYYLIQRWDEKLMHKMLFK